MTRQSLRITLLVFATLGVSALPGQCAQSTTPTAHKKSTGATTSSAAKPKSATGSTATSKSSSAKSGLTAASKSGTSKSSSGKTSSTKSGAGAGKTSAKKSTSSASSKHGTKKSTGGRQRGQMAPTPERITEIQEALSKNGAMSAAPSGKWDDSTADAMRKFQAAHGLNPTGKLDAQTLNHLGLGSATSGLAPPAPTVRTSSASLPADIQQ